MADITDVADGLAGFISGLVYPNGVGGAGSPAVLTSIYAGWPDQRTLDGDLGIATGTPLAYHITVCPLAMERDTTRGFNDWEEQPLPAATYDAAISGQTITITGAAPNPYRVQNVGLVINRKAYVYQALANDTPTIIAAALAALVSVDFIGTFSAGPVVTVAAGGRIAAARVGVVGSAQMEVGSQEKGFQITIWTDTPGARSALAKRFDAALRAADRFTLADGSVASLRYHWTNDTDRANRQGIYRRDILYMVEFATLLVQPATQIIAAITQLQNPPGTTIATVSN